ncbi:hypothetical protein Skr01_54460 [Sphaerisporangium krabiense]|nr:hypothetical protein Skr01_54460 [Sphaerisporangium krabiense]
MEEVEDVDEELAAAGSFLPEPESDLEADPESEELPDSDLADDDEVVEVEEPDERLSVR